MGNGTKLKRAWIALVCVLLGAGCDNDSAPMTADSGPDLDAGTGPPDAGPDSESDTSVAYAVASTDGTLATTFGTLPYRVYWPEGFTDSTSVVHVSRGGNGLGDDRGALLSYVESLVGEGYVVVQVDHRIAGRDIENIARLRGEEIRAVSAAVERGELEYGAFSGSVDGSAQGFMGHSGGCMEGLMAVGTAMTHGSYSAPAIRALYCMSPAGYDPDQFGIVEDPPGYASIGASAVFVVLGEEETDTNGPGTFMSDGWRLQAYAAMSDAGPRYQAVISGPDTGHQDVKGNNRAIEAYNRANALALFATYLRGGGVASTIGRLALPDTNEVALQSRGTP